jgi:hypothetical protein
MSNKTDSIMKNKALIFAGLCTFTLCALQVQAINHETNPIYYNEVDNLPAGYSKIDLRGKLDRNAGPNAVVAGASENSVYIAFNQDFGNVSISIYNEAGLVVYSTVVNTSVQQVVIIPFSSAASGTYTVELNSANGYVDGDFEHD